ncbi:hypothetical protein [Sphingomonas suaedae]|uniref:hypothetical protein n=1 Tax=Sphingomonas suaedae TaxID=2599297 RepID=UPI001647C836|nr:hypothetical protein [Sphingomonas suaedae]
MRLTFTCQSCGSKHVTRDAWAEWSEERQKWVLNAVFDYAFCHSCAKPTQLVEDSIAEP